MRGKEAGKTGRKTEGQGIVLDESLAYYKLKILPSLVFSRHEEEGTVYICASVPLTQQLETGA